MTGKRIVCAAAALLAAVLTAAGCSENRESEEKTQIQTEAEETEAEETEAEAAGLQAEEEAWPVTMKEIISANRGSVILSRYEDVLIEKTENDRNVLTIYREKDFLYYRDPNLEEISFDGAIYGCYDHQHYSGRAVLGKAWDQYERFFADASVDPVYTGYETITGVLEEDGILKVSTRLEKNALPPELQAAMGEEEVSCELLYTLNRSDLTVRSIEEQRYVQGELIASSVTEMKYNAGRPEAAEKIYRRVDNPDEIRKVTFVLNPGTVRESSSTHLARKDEGIWIDALLTDSPQYELYEDPQMTVPFTGGKSGRDQTVYLKEAEKQTDPG